MVQGKSTAGDLLYHAVHGLCRIDRIIKEKQSGKEVLRYSLVPKVTNKMKMRFIIGSDDMQISGFHTLVSVKEANQVMDYLKAGDPAAAFGGPNEAWSFAQAILSFSADKTEAKDQRKRQALQRSVKGLLGELAFVFNLPLKETADRIKKSLGSPSKVSPLVTAALVNAVED